MHGNYTNDQLLILKSKNFQTFKRQPHKMVKHTKIIRGQKPTNCLSVLDHFVGLALKGLINSVQLQLEQLLVPNLYLKVKQKTVLREIYQIQVFVKTITLNNHFTVFQDTKIFQKWKIPSGLSRIKEKAFSQIILDKTLGKKSRNYAK